MIVNNKDIFHVHTYRCGHAEKISDEEYIKKAVSIGATGIWFTDHAPFPGDPFENRMKYSELKGYINELYELKHKYENVLNVHIGLEIEYFPSYDKDGYYRELKSNEYIEILLLGQHIAEITPGHYTFELDKEKLAHEEYVILGNSQIMGIKSGYFDAVAHPDRIFRRQRIWTEKMSEISKRIIDVAAQAMIPIEINEASKRRKYNYWKEFWELGTKVQHIHGVDAHSLKEIRFEEN